MSSLKIHFFGSPRIELDGSSFKFTTRKNTALIAYLGITGETHTRETLITLLWPELEPGRARANLRRNLSDIKKGWGDRWLIVEGEYIQLDVSSDAWLDVTQFNHLLSLWKTHAHPGAETCPVCLSALVEASEIYTGDFLAGFSLRDSRNFDEWQFFKTEELRSQLASALVQLVGTFCQLGNYKSALPYAQRWLQIDPLHEAAHRQLMHIYAWTGQRSAALRQFDECAKVLEEELGVAPEDETIQAYQIIKSKQKIPATVKTSLVKSTMSEHNLPLQTTPFIGRESELAELIKLLTNPDVRLVSILGAGGMGKTRLAVEASGACVMDFSDGVHFIALAHHESVDSLTPTIAKGFNFSFYERGDPQKQLFEYLRSKNTLLVLDNFEHLLNGTGWVSDLLKTAADVKIMVTSRAKLDLQAEYQFPITGMGYPPSKTDLADIFLDDKRIKTQYSAIQLFTQAAIRVKPNFELTANNFEDVVRICQLVQGMPLALLLAATWMDMLDPEEIAVEISHGIDFLKSDQRDIPDRQRSVRVVFDHSWNLLSASEKQILQALSIFRGGFTRLAADQITGCSLIELKALVNKSLVYMTREGRYEMHDLLRQFAIEKLMKSTPAYQAAREAHTDYYTTFLNQQEWELKGPQPGAALAEIELESENARVAWKWAVEQSQIDRLEKALEGLCFFYLCRMRYQEGVAACRMAAESLSSYSTTSEMLVTARCLMWLGCFYRRLGYPKEASKLLKKSLAILENPELTATETQPIMAAIQLQLGHTHFDDDRVLTRQSYEKSLTLYKAAGDRWGEANALSALSWSVWSGGAYDQAEDLFRESLEIRQTLGDTMGIIDSLSGLGNLGLFQGTFEESEQLLRESRAILQKVVNESNIPDADTQATAPFDEPVEASSQYRQNVGLFSDLGFSHSLAPSNTMLGFIKKHLGQYSQARIQGEQGLKLAQQTGWRQEEGLCLEVIGEIDLVEEKYSQAQVNLHKSVKILQETNQIELFEVLAVMGYAYRGLGDIGEAKKYTIKALKYASEVRTQFPLITAIPIAALIMADQGEIEYCVELFALASRYPRVANSQWFEDIAGRYIDEFAARLPPNVSSTAKARGRARDLDETVAEILDKLTE